ncbi:MAG: hypothetical protein IKX85_04695 [Clostridia bacterium]|nr:hypothetical protein [Clostridia bacterium]
MRISRSLARLSALILCLSLLLVACRESLPPEKEGGTDASSASESAPGSTESEPESESAPAGEGAASGALRDFSSMTIPHGFVNPRNVSQKPTDPEYIHAFSEGEVRRLEAYAISNSREEYREYIRRVCALFSGAEESAFPDLADEWFERHALVSACVYIWGADGRWSDTRVLAERRENGCLYLMIGLEGVGLRLSSLDPEPYLVGSFLYGAEKDASSPLTDLLLETRLLGSGKDPSEAERDAEAFLSARSPRFSEELSGYFSYLCGGPAEAADALYYSAEEGVVFEEKNADVPIALRIRLKPSLLRGGADEKPFPEEENELYERVFGELGIREVYPDGESVYWESDLSDEGGNKWAISLPLPDNGAREEASLILLYRCYVRATPRLLSVWMEDPRIVSVSW